MSEWKDFELKELTTKIGSGATPRGGQEAYKAEGISLIRSQNILDFSFSYSGLAFIDDEQAHDLRNVIIEKDDVLINITGDSVARVAKVPDNVLPARVNQHVAILRADKEKLDSDYLLYYLLNPVFKRHLLRIASDGATRNALTKADLEELVIVAPEDVNIQKEIAHLLSIYDQKITLIRQQNQDLEELAQTLFKRWFVEFEFPCLPSSYRPQGQVNLSSLAKVCTYKRVGGLPVPDGKSWFTYVLLCEDGSFYKGMTNDLYRRFYEHYIGEGANHTKTHKPVKVIHWEQFDTQDEARKREEDLKTGYGRTWLQREYDKLLKYGSVASDGLPAQNEGSGLPAHQTRLMTAGKMVESELGEIPEGWKCQELQELVTVKRGGSPRPIQDFIVDNGFPWVKISDATATDSPFLLETKEFIKEEGLSKTVYLKKGSLILSNSATPGLPKFLELDACIHDGWLYFPKITVINQNYMYLLFLHLKRKIVQQGSGSVFTNLKTDILKEQLLPVAPKSILSKFSEANDLLFEKIRRNTIEIQTLTQLRDTLLPKLMSGELRVENIIH